jgi:hypothetical protein
MDFIWKVLVFCNPILLPGFLWIATPTVGQNVIPRFETISVNEGLSQSSVSSTAFSDNVGDDAYNMKLSHDRPRSVLDYLVTAGIPISRVQAKGYGELNPVVTNDTDEGRKTNRRTEFIILEF